MHSRLLLTGTALALFSVSEMRAQFQPSTTISGYGELHYNEPDGSPHGLLDFHRFVLSVDHDFTEHLSLRSEVELEHTKVEAGQSRGGEIAVEEAFLEYRPSSWLGMRGGIILPPVGITNQTHEPPTFNSVERPSVETVIIPTTWSEAGAGIFGAPMGNLSYQLYVVAGLDAAGFTAADGIGGGKQDGFQSDASNPSLTGRVEWAAIDGVVLGGSFFAGNSSAANDSIGNAPVRLWSADARFSTGGFSLRWVGAVVTIGDGGLINRRFAEHVADRLYGYYLEGSYDILRVLTDTTAQRLNLFARYEKYDTQASLQDLPTASQYDRQDIIIGAAYFPVENVAIKADYVFLRNALNAGLYRNTGRLDLGLGYSF